MKNKSNILNKLKNNVDINLHCKYIPPHIPNKTTYNKSSWSARLIYVQNNKSTPLSDWFIIPNSTMNNIINPGNISESFILLLDKLNDKEFNNLFKQDKPNFKIENNNYKETIKWLNNI